MPTSGTFVLLLILMMNCVPNLVFQRKERSRPPPLPSNLLIDASNQCWHTCTIARYIDFEL